MRTGCRMVFLCICVCFGLSENSCEWASLLNPFPYGIEFYWMWSLCFLVTHFISLITKRPTIHKRISHHPIRCWVVILNAMYVIRYHMVFICWSKMCIHFRWTAALPWNSNVLALVGFFPTVIIIMLQFLTTEPCGHMHTAREKDRTGIEVLYRDVGLKHYHSFCTQYCSILV